MMKMAKEQEHTKDRYGKQKEEGQRCFGRYGRGRYALI